MKSLCVGAAAAAALLGGCAIGGPAYGPRAPEVAAVVSMTTLLSFTPGEVTVRSGQTVEWRNTAIMHHTVTADPSLARNPALVELPAGAARFNSGNVEPGGVWRHTFTTPGRYRYICLPHEGQGMHGVVNVTP